MTLLFLFDMDDVLYDYDWRARMHGLTALTGIDFAELRRRWWHEEGETAAEAGRFADGAAYLAALEAALGVPIAADDWIANRRSAMRPRPDAIAGVARAAELGQVSLLTNNGPLLDENLAAIAPEIAPLFGDHLRTTSRYGARKPDPAVFERVLATYETAAEDVLFVDDLPENVAAAASLGITTYLYGTADGLRAAIDDFARTRSAAA
ncbi:HAD-IA family hydrolase [Homoserinibacter sp. GY 40078]|uniref:HAD-IA family hydrolase n=1 Tax=Homoserinibacter sp. GY 40078 TaxID=2603275 RepID=UPI0011CCC367|nr:HAD-IA family hydrolase [Homoserinibacter sp. GY 40078]TXK17252.1 HAD-IA family hydrolase [Homoserinibacter sp. GY 40078]